MWLNLEIWPQYWLHLDLKIKPHLGLSKAEFWYRPIQLLPIQCLVKTDIYYASAFTATSHGQVNSLSSAKCSSDGNRQHSGQWAQPYSMTDNAGMQSMVREHYMPFVQTNSTLTWNQFNTDITGDRGQSLVVEQWDSKSWTSANKIVCISYGFL